MKVAVDVQIRPEEKQGTRGEEEVPLWSLVKGMVPSKRDGEG